MAPLVDNPQIKHAELLSPLPLYLHTYIWPFAIVWPIFFRYYLSTELYDVHIGGQEWTFVFSGTIFTIQALFWLSTHWSVNVKARFTATKAASIEEAQLIKVLPVANAGSDDICRLIRDKVRHQDYPICNHCTY
jgi:cation-transporting ATPase 13A1